MEVFDFHASDLSARWSWLFPVLSRFTLPCEVGYCFSVVCLCVCVCVHSNWKTTDQKLMQLLNPFWWNWPLLTTSSYRWCWWHWWVIGSEVKVTGNTFQKFIFNWSCYWWFGRVLSKMLSKGQGHGRDWTRYGTAWTSMLVSVEDSKMWQVIVMLATG